MTQMEFFEDTLSAEKVRLSDNFAEGTSCKCCGQFVKLYVRKLYSTQMYGLIKLVKFYEEDPTFYHITKLSQSGHGGDFAKLELFGLVVQEFNSVTEKRTSGMWQPTGKGIAFVKEVIAVPESVQIYNGEVHGFSTKGIYIREVIKNKFDYEELMNG